MRCLGRVLVRASAAMLVVGGALWVDSPVLAAADGSKVTFITVDGRARGALFAGVGSISGGAGTSRLLIDYPEPQRSQILDYLFGPGGADLQVLKLEIGADTAESGGAEPSVAPSRDEIDCRSGDEWWLAEQAVARHPGITLMGLQWAAPGWVGISIWRPADIGYVIDWLRCAKSHRLTISYIGGWNEHGYVKAWYKGLRSALNSHGFRAVKIIGADSFPGRAYDWARTFRVAADAAADPKFKAALSVIGVHDTCGGPTTGFLCRSTPTARRLGLPLWESELGSLKGSTAPANMARSINNGFIQAGMTGFLQWPLSSSAPPGILQRSRGLVIAEQPQSGNYAVQPITWAIAQTTQFTRPGWRYVPGASRTIGSTGNYVSYESPNRSDWSLVAENTGNRRSQRIGPQTIKVHLLGGLKIHHISVWSTNLLSPNPASWFVRQPDVRVWNGTFSYVIRRGYVVSFTSTTGQFHLRVTPPASRPMTLPFSAARDAGNEAWGLATEEGAFVYKPCLGGVTGQCLTQRASQVPVFFQVPRSGIPVPYAVVGDPKWANYTVSARVLITKKSGWAGLISRFSAQDRDPRHFDGYEFHLDSNGHWQLLRNAYKASMKTLATGVVAGITTGRWHTISFQASATTLAAAIDGTVVARTLNAACRSGLAGIMSNWTSVQFADLTVR